MGGAKCMGQLNCAIDSHSTGHVGASLALLLLHFLHSHAATSCVIWPCSVFIVLLCCVGKCHRSGTPSQCFVILGNEWVCHLVIGHLSPYGIANICHGSLLYSIRWDLVF